MTSQKSRDIHRGFQLYHAGKHLGSASNTAINAGLLTGGTYAAARYISGREASAKKFAGHLFVGSNWGIGPKGRARVVRWFPKTAAAMNRGAQAVASVARKSKLIRRGAEGINQAGRRFHVERWAPKAIGYGIGASLGALALTAYGKNLIKKNLKGNAARKAS